MPQQSEIRIPDLTRLDQLDLERSLSADGVRFEQEAHAGDTHGELATATAVVIVSGMAIKAIAAFLAKRNERKSFRQRVEVVRPDGTREVREIAYDQSSSDPPEPEVIRQLGEMLNVDVHE